MRTRLQRDFRFEAAHFLPAVPPSHKCARMHGHSYALTVTLEGDVDPATGWLIDFAEIDGLANPTSELLAAWVWRHVVDVLPGLVEIVVSETPTSRCIYREPGK